MPTTDECERIHLAVRRGDSTGLRAMIDRLISLGYTHDPSVGTPGTYRQEGDALHIWGYGDISPSIVSFWGDEVDDILEK